ncbi:hypothetical protein KPH14_010679 [Odynerus spinipes]|uniref:Uncharacterized protein n=1 Tax=Odynerus spinipes TaxID=1348599 RepID=A0AAD9RUV7_9HYME|nr:hypothetical protein KPH14_010679 [Odynerus spinipes]
MEYDGNTGVRINSFVNIHKKSGNQKGGRKFCLEEETKYYRGAVFELRTYDKGCCWKWSYARTALDRRENRKMVDGAFEEEHFFGKFCTTS